MTTVFLSGSRAITRLEQAVQSRIQEIIDQNIRVVVGDAGGADRAMQSWLAAKKYPHVTVFCVGDKCRNNVGPWPIENIHPDPQLKGRAPYTRRDEAMAARADFGLILWDGKSEGSLNNLFELLKQNKNTKLYFTPRKQFFDIDKAADAEALLQFCQPAASRSLYNSNHLRRQMETLSIANQQTLQWITHPTPALHLGEKP